MIPVVRAIAKVREQVREARGAGKTIGFVPTMGALHEGHASLIRSARQETAFVVVSIFVNPLQFGPQEDLARYPRTLEADHVLCTEAGAALTFAPTPEEIYPADFTTSVEVAGLDGSLCGPSRPGHFRGVATVVLKLFNIVQPDVAFFGQKDAQQARILVQMVRDLNLPLRMSIQPTVREADGLALSSRNRYLKPEERQHAPVLFRVLEETRRAIERGATDVALLQEQMLAQIAATPGTRVDYVEIVDAATLQPVSRIEKPVLLALAVFFGTTRLIDNVLAVPRS